MTGRQTQGCLFQKTARPGNRACHGRWAAVLRWLDMTYAGRRGRRLRSLRSRLRSRRGLCRVGRSLLPLLLHIHSCLTKVPPGRRRRCWRWDWVVRVGPHCAGTGPACKLCCAGTTASFRIGLEVSDCSCGSKVGCREPPLSGGNSALRPAKCKAKWDKALHRCGQIALAICRVIHHTMTDVACAI